MKKPFLVTAGVFRLNKLMDKRYISGRNGSLSFDEN